MTTFFDRRRRRLVITIELTMVVLVAASVTFWLRARSSGRDEADHVNTGTTSVASHRIGQRLAPPPRLPDLARPGEEERILPQGWQTNVLSASSEAVTMRMPTAGEEEPVRAHRFVPDQQPPATRPPNPFIPPKQDLSEEDLRAGLPAE